VAGSRHGGLDLTTSVVVVAYRSGPALGRCLDSLASQTDEVIVVNNGESGTEIDAARALDHVSVVDPGRNTGFAGGCNAGAVSATGEVLLFLNPDTVAAEGSVAALAESVADPAIGVAMARLRLLDRPDVLNSSGNVVHISGLAWAGGYGQPAETLSEPRDIPYASGAALAIRADVFDELGGFTEELFMYQEDLELCWRARLHGLRVVATPAADVYHEYDYGRHRPKRYFLERNRLIFVSTAFPARLLLLAAPVILVGELALVLLALLEGWIGAKLGGWWWLIRHPRWLIRHRRETMRLRRVPVREVSRFLTPVIDPQMVAVPSVVGLANRLMSAYWWLARRAL
jgi:GT2 family glycosyltransferase